MVKGIVNERVMPTVQASIKNKEGEWEELTLLLDTGFSGELILESTLLQSYNLDTHPDHRGRDPNEVLSSPQNWDPIAAPYTGTLYWRGIQRNVGIRLIGEHPHDGLLGTKLLEYTRLTVDLVPEGAVTVESEVLQASVSKFQDPKILADSREEHLKWHNLPLAWTKLQVYDSGGNPESIWVNVDTGDNRELNLTNDWIRELNLEATSETSVHTVDGLVQTERGEVEILWEGKQRKVEWTRVVGDKPPTIGTELLKGKRITMYFEPAGTAAEIRDIPRPPGSIQRFLNAVRNTLRS